MKKYISLVAWLLAGALALTVFIKWLLPWTAPLWLALLLAAFLEPWTSSLTRHGWKRGIAAAVLTLALTLGAGGMVYLILYKGLGAADGFIRSLPELIHAAVETLAGYRAAAEKYISQTPPEAQLYLNGVVDSFTAALEALPERLSEKFFSFITAAAQSGAEVFLFVLTAVLGTYFASASYPKLRSALSGIIPEESRQRLDGVSRDLKTGFSGYIRAQLILMALTFGELIVAFLLMGIKNCLLPALLTAIVDALPLFGVGIVLVPWAAGAWLTGSPAMAAELLVTWAAVSLVRNLAQARLIGEGIGLSPLASLGAIYAGWRIAGVGGMILLPILVAILNRLIRQGMIRLPYTRT